MAQPQSFKNHTRFDPLVHFSTMPILLVNLGFSVYATIAHWPYAWPLFVWWIVMSFCFLLMNAAARMAALRAQDRIVRLEEQLRLADLLPESGLDLIEKLTIRQLIALRFASDAEVTALARRAVAEGLTEKQIKQAIVTWRPDEHRV